MNTTNLNAAHLTSSDLIAIEREARAMQAKVLGDLMRSAWTTVATRLSFSNTGLRTA